MRPKMLVHPSQARTIDSPAEIERLLAMGWLLAAPKPKSRMAGRMRVLRERRRAAGWLSMYLWLTPEEAAAVRAVLRQGESYQALLVRLVAERSLLFKDSQVSKQN